MHKPSYLPETAKDTYGIVSAAVSKKKNDEKTENKAPSELPGEGEAKPADFIDKDVAELKKEKVVDSLEKEEMFIQEKENSSIEEPPALKEDSETLSEEVFVNEGKKEEPKKIVHKEISKPKFEPRSRNEGFFRDFEKFLNNKGLNEKFISELLDKDLLHKMKQFHVQREEGTPFFFHAEDSDKELLQKMEGLQLLEEEWYIRHKNLKEAEFLLLEKEAEIDLRLEELKGVLKHIKQREKLERKSKKNNYFVLGNGRVLRSIGDLRDSLKTMKDDLFKFHVSGKKNDFAEWTKNVFKEGVLADKMSSVKSRKELLNVLYEF